MAKYDLQTAAAGLAKSLGEGVSPLGAIQVEFGVPSCLMNLAKEALNLLPTDVLGGMRNDMAIGRNAADAVTKALSQKLRNLTGIIEFDTDDGVFRFVSDASQYGQDSGSVAGAVGNFLSLAQQAIGFGSELYSNYQSAEAQIQGIVDCVSDYSQFLKNIGGESGDLRADTGIGSPSTPNVFDTLLENEYGNDITAATVANDFVNKVSKTIANIDSILSERVNDPTKEPILLDSGVSGTPDTTSVFRIEAGPPESGEGQFILSVDGLYYDSQTSGITPALLELSNRETERDPSLDWKLEYDPNLGGRGVPVTMEDLNVYNNTLFDLRNIDDSIFLQKYYDQDNVLVNLIGQRNRKVYDVSAELQQNIDAGSSQAIINNLKQVMISDSNDFMTQINKRKKQIELAVKLPRQYGKGVLFKPGEVPVNDFSYLAGINYYLELETQKKIMIRRDDVKGVVLPLDVKFSEKLKNFNDRGFSEFYINAVPDGVTIDSANASASVSASLISKPVIETDGLFALYNYLTLESVEPSSVEYKLRNSTSSNIEYNAQLVGDAGRILHKGLGIPYFSGICIPDNTGGIVEAGSYVKLPQKQKFQDLLYNRSGATFETWIHVPNLSSTDAFNHTSEVSGLYRLILANENTGGSPNQEVSPDSDILNSPPNNSVTTTRGMILGFTRDRRFTQGKLPSNEESDNPTQDVSLVLAPTQSFDNSSISFIVERSFESCESASSWKGMVIPVSSTFGTTTLSSCTDSFCQLSITFNPIRDEIKVYLDGVNLATSSYGNVFSINPRKETPRIPTIVPESAFEYNVNNIAASSLKSYRYGPKLDLYFTPWIIGGGYTDGNPNGNFLGGEYGGKISGLKGYLGCTKFYSKPLSNSEILNNYNATKNFFKNIRL